MRHSGKIIANDLHYASMTPFIPSLKSNGFSGWLIIKSAQERIDDKMKREPTEEAATKLLDTYYKNGQRLVENYIRYGSTTWYEWACVNWGTKWNADSYEKIKEDGDETTFRFDTAWCPPGGILNILAEKGLDMKLEYHIESNGSGCTVWKNGKIVSDTYDEYDF